MSDGEEAEREPECGEDFCEECGDCMACYGDQGCPNNYGNDYRHEWRPETEGVGE